MTWWGTLCALWGLFVSKCSNSMAHNYVPQSYNSCLLVDLSVRLPATCNYCETQAIDTHTHATFPFLDAVKTKSVISVAQKGFSDSADNRQESVSLPLSSQTECVLTGKSEKDLLCSRECPPSLSLNIPDNPRNRFFCSYIWKMWLSNYFGKPLATVASEQKNLMSSPLLVLH